MRVAPPTFFAGFSHQVHRIFFVLALSLTQHHRGKYIRSFIAATLVSALNFLGDARRSGTFLRRLFTSIELKYFHRVPVLRIAPRFSTLFPPYSPALSSQKERERASRCCESSVSSALSLSPSHCSALYTTREHVCFILASNSPVYIARFRDARYIST